MKVTLTMVDRLSFPGLVQVEKVLLGSGQHVLATCLCVSVHIQRADSMKGRQILVGDLVFGLACLGTGSTWRDLGLGADLDTAACGGTIDYIVD